MKTGFPFLDVNEPREGQLVLLACGMGCARKTLGTNVATEMARRVPLVDDRPERRVIHFDLERTNQEWKSHVDELCGNTLPLDYRNQPPALSPRDQGSSPEWAQDLGRDILVIDPIEIAVSAEDRQEFARRLKRHAVQQATVVVVMMQVALKNARQLNMKSWLPPQDLPVWALQSADHIYYATSTSTDMTLVAAKNGEHVTCSEREALFMMSLKNGRLAP